MIDIRDLTKNLQRYRAEVAKRNLPPDLADKAFQAYEAWRLSVTEHEKLLEESNRKSKAIPVLAHEEREKALSELKVLSDRIKQTQDAVQQKRKLLDEILPKLPVLSWDGVPLGNSEADNKVIKTSGEKPAFSFSPRPYYELPMYEKFVCPDEGVRAFGSRGYYLRGPVALFQKALFEYATEIILAEGFELVYPPLLLNTDILTATGHLPDFDGQQYEVSLGDSRVAYLIGSAEPSLMAFFAYKKLDAESLPCKVTAWTSCFRKEAGSYGKDQKGIIRNHQFEKVEIVNLCLPDQSNDMLIQLQGIEEKIYDGLGLHYREVEICTSELPKKHSRQIDFEAWFPGQQKFIEISSNGNAADFQTRSLGIHYRTKGSKLSIPHSLNCTGITFRTGLALIEQGQQADGSVRLPKVLAPRMGLDLIKTNY